MPTTIEPLAAAASRPLATERLSDQLAAALRKAVPDFAQAVADNYGTYGLFQTKLEKRLAELQDLLARLEAK